MMVQRLIIKLENYQWKTTINKTNKQTYIIYTYILKISKKAFYIKIVIDNN